jgi:hypothetical protein
MIAGVEGNRCGDATKYEEKARKKTAVTTHRSVMCKGQISSGRVHWLEVRLGFAD